MIKLKNILTETDLVTSNSWGEYTISVLSDDELNTLYDMFKETYGKMGNIIRTVSSAEKLKTHKYVLLIDYDNDNAFDAFIIYNPISYGNKIVYLGSKNNIVAKSILMKKFKDLLLSKNWFIEGGRKIEDFCVKYKIPYIDDMDIVTKIIKNKKIEPSEDGYYIRKAAFGAGVKKRLYGAL